MISNSYSLEEKENILIDKSADIWSKETISYLTNLSSDKLLLSSDQVEMGEFYLNLFLNSSCTNYSLLKGKSGLIAIISFYIYRLPYKERKEKTDKLIEKLMFERALLLTESTYNDLSTGRIGFIVSLTLLYNISEDLRIGELINEISTLFVEDTRFFRGGIAWIFSDLKREDVYNPGNNLEIFFGLMLLNKMCKSRFTDILLKNIVFEKNGYLIHKSIYLKKNTPNYLIPDKIVDKKKFDVNANKIYNMHYKNDVTQVYKTTDVFYFLWNSCIVDELKFDSRCIFLSPEQGLYILIKSNFPECSNLVIENLLSMIKNNNYSLRIMDVLNLIRKIAIKEKNIDLIYNTKLSKLKSRLINRSLIFYESRKIKSLTSSDYKFLSDLELESFLDIKFSINRKDFFFDIFSTTWIFEPIYKRKKLIGCFKINRFDKNIFVDTSIIDGVLISFFNFIGLGVKSIRDFAETELNGYSINYNHFKSRVLYLIQQGVLVPCIS